MCKRSTRSAITHSDIQWADNMPHAGGSNPQPSHLRTANSDNFQTGKIPQFSWKQTKWRNNRRPGRSVNHPHSRQRELYPAFWKAPKMKNGLPDKGIISLSNGWYQNGNGKEKATRAFAKFRHLPVKVKYSHFRDSYEMKTAQAERRPRRSLNSDTFEPKAHISFSWKVQNCKMRKMKRRPGRSINSATFQTRKYTPLYGMYRRRNGNRRIGEADVSAGPRKMRQIGKADIR